MAIQTFKGVLPIPNNSLQVDSVMRHDLTIGTLDAAGDDIALVFQAPETGTIKAISFYTDVVTVGDDVDVRLETVDTTTGFPTGTLATAGANATQTIADANDATRFDVTLGTGHSATVGDVLAAVVTAPAGWVSGNLQLAGSDRSYVDKRFPYVAVDTGTGYADGPTAIIPSFAVGYDDGGGGITWNPVPGTYPYDQPFTVTYDSGTAVTEVGNHFSLPFPCRIVGVWARIDSDLEDITFHLRSADGSTSHASVTKDKDVQQGTGTGPLQLYFTAPYTITANTGYKIVAAPVSTGDVIAYGFNVNTAAKMDAFDFGQLFYRTTKTSGTWGVTTTQQVFMGILVDGFDDGVGGAGGLLVHPGMAGGMRG